MSLCGPLRLCPEQAVRPFPRHAAVSRAKDRLHWELCRQRDGHPCVRTQYPRVIGKSRLRACPSPLPPPLLRAGALIFGNFVVSIAMIALGSSRGEARTRAATMPLSFCVFPCGRPLPRDSRPASHLPREYRGKCCCEDVFAAWHPAAGFGGCRCALSLLWSGGVSAIVAPVSVVGVCVVAPC